mmetsp:Transcript_19829/g.43151  ORF Transcript_19829/g.43151 Transcript_19829/m.43151 type:complete len:1013 (+) Transcript_19829:140-3178(+)
MSIEPGRKRDCTGTISRCTFSDAYLDEAIAKLRHLIEKNGALAPSVCEKIPFISRYINNLSSHEIERLIVEKYPGGGSNTASTCSTSDTDSFIETTVRAQLDDGRSAHLGESIKNEVDGGTRESSWKQNCFMGNASSGLTNTTACSDELHPIIEAEGDSLGEEQIRKRITELISFLNAPAPPLPPQIVHESRNFSSAIDCAGTSTIEISATQGLYVPDDDDEAPPLTHRFTVFQEEDSATAEKLMREAGTCNLNFAANDEASSVIENSARRGRPGGEGDNEAPSLPPQTFDGREEDHDAAVNVLPDDEGIPIIRNSTMQDPSIREYDDVNVEDSQLALSQRQVTQNGVNESDRPSVQSVLRRLTNIVHGSENLRGAVLNILHGHDTDHDPEVLVSATLVEEGSDVVGGEVVMAEPVSFFDRKWKSFALPTCILLALLAVLLPLTLTGIINSQGEQYKSLDTPQPSFSPTFDTRATLEIIQTRGYVRCGLLNMTINSGQGFHLDLCRSVAAVVVGTPDGFEGVPTTYSNRWQRLHDKTVDLVILGDTHTIEREVRESSTGAGFSFSSPYNYDGMVYFGNGTFVRCAEDQKRYDECSDLLICVVEGSTHHVFVARTFPSDYYKLGSSLEEITEMLLNGSCNIGTYDKSAAQSITVLNDGIRDGIYTLGNKILTEEPLAIASRNTDWEFSDIINWVVHALFFGEEQGLTKNETLCQNYTGLSSHVASDLDFMNAVYCVGNYGDLFDGGGNNRGRNQINNGTGMLYAVPFGDLDIDTIVEPAIDSMLSKLRAEGTIHCGVTIPANFTGRVIESGKLVGMGVDYCRALSAAIFTGDSEAVKFTTFPDIDNSSFVSLANGTIDVIVGGRVQREYDFESSATPEGFHFSTPYYYGNEPFIDNVSFYSVVTREDDVLFASFVNCIVLATIYAQTNGITRDKSGDMPYVSVFGTALNWALRDAIAYSGGYGEIYSRNFGGDGGYDQIASLSIESGGFKSTRGRNTLNKGGPLMLSFPHLPP